LIKPLGSSAGSSVEGASTVVEGRRRDISTPTRECSTMPRQYIPKNAGPYVIVVAMAGNYAVTNNRRKQRVWISCRNRAHANEICARLNAGEHGEIWM
jgi:hypothetical protein